MAPEVKVSLLETRGATPAQMLGNIVVSIVGTGVLGLPYAFRTAGWLAGVAGAGAAIFYCMLLQGQATGAINGGGGRAPRWRPLHLRRSGRAMLRRRRQALQGGHHRALPHRGLPRLHRPEHQLRSLALSPAAVILQWRHLITILGLDRKRQQGSVPVRSMASVILILLLQCTYKLRTKEGSEEERHLEDLKLGIMF